MPRSSKNAAIVAGYFQGPEAVLMSTVNSNDFEIVSENAAGLLTVLN